MTARLLASKCSQTVDLVAYIGNCHTPMSIDIYDVKHMMVTVNWVNSNDGSLNDVSVMTVKIYITLLLKQLEQQKH